MEEKGGQETENDEVLHDEDNNENADNVAQTVGHNMYILAYQVSIFIIRSVFIRKTHKFDIYPISLCFHIIQQMEKYSQVQNKAVRTHTHENFFLYLCKYLAIPPSLPRDDGKL